MALKGVVLVSPATVPGTGGALPETHHVANQPIVCHALQALADAGAQALAVVAPAATMLELRTCVERSLDAGPAVAFLPWTGRQDLIGALRSASRFVGHDPAAVQLADGLLGERIGPLAEPIAGGAADLLLVLHRSTDRGTVLEPELQALLGLSELDHRQSHLALAGACLFGPGVLKRTVRDRPSETASPALGEIAAQLGEIAKRVSEQRGTIDAALVGVWRRYRGDPVDLLELNHLVLDRLQVPRADPSDEPGNRVEGRVLIDPTAQIRASTILGPCVIGPGTRITNSYIGPYTSVGADVEIEGAEIVGSIVCEGVRIMHVSGRIEGSTIGRRSSIFRDFRLPRAMRLHVGDGVEMALD
ncbi:MAG: hypothetical protein ACRDMX_06165 [Solirubrobacteraceae bacterium]